MIPLSTALSLFPSAAHSQLSVGLYGHTVAPHPISLGTPPPLTGLEVRFHELSEDENLEEVELLSSPFIGTQSGAMLRMYIDPDGILQVDQLHADSVLASVRVRRELGDLFDLALLGGHWETTWTAVDTGRFQLRAITPHNLTLLGFSNTDQDDDSKLKHYISIGSGIGGELIGTLLGPVGIFAQAQGLARTMNRHRADARNYVRHEVCGEAELGVAWTGTRHALMLTGWSELTTQWETRDDDGKSGVDRQQTAWGIRLSGRRYSTALSESDREGAEVVQAMHR